MAEENIEQLKRQIELLKLELLQEKTKFQKLRCEFYGCFNVVNAGAVIMNHVRLEIEARE
jgi:hypothetical protein